MTGTSEVWADLGGGMAPPRLIAGLSPQHRRHRFDPLSGYCGCGVRDDGQITEYSPAWRDLRASRSEVSQ